MTVLITLTIAGADTGPFDLYSNIDGYVTPFETGVAKASLTSGYSSILVPDYTVVIRVVSDGDCPNYLDILLQDTITTTTSTSSTSTTSTSTTTITTTTDGYNYYLATIYVCGSCAPLTYDRIRSLTPLTLGVYYNPGDGYIYRTSGLNVMGAYVAEFGAVYNAATCVLASGIGC